MFRMIRSDIYYDKAGELDIDYYKDNHRGIPIKQGRDAKNVPYITADKLLNGHKVYSVYSFGKGDDYVGIFKDIKKGSMNRELYDEWINHTAFYINSTIFPVTGRPDIIAVPQSSSNLINDLAKELTRLSGIDYLPNAFIKNPVDEIIIDIPEGVKVSESALKSAEKALDRIRQIGKFEAKAVPKRMLKFFRNIYTDDDGYVDILRGKKLAVLDDSITSKATMMNIFDVCDYLYETAESFGITIFKKTGSNKSKM